MTYAHYIRSARRKLEEERQFCAEKRNLALQLETGMSWINSLLKLSGQLVLIGGLSGIVSWFVLGETKLSGDILHQTLLAIAFAFASMIFSMAMQLRSMTLSNRKINFEYHLGLDRAKEKQAKSLIDGLLHTQERFKILLKKRFGDQYDVTARYDITSELSIFQQLKHTDDPHREVSFTQAFKDWIFSFIPK